MALNTTISRVVSLLALLLACTGGGAAPQSKQRPKPPCCFNHPRYTGSCMVEPAGDETCGSILTYLNNPKGAGKSYCNNTTVRGGWRAVRCKPERGAIRPGLPYPDGRSTHSTRWRA